MSNSIGLRQPQVVFEYTKGSILHSVHADGFIGGLTPGGYIHLAFFSERSMLPKRHVFKLNPDGSLGPEIPDEAALQDPIVRDFQVDVLLTASTAEVLRNWLDHHITNLRARMSGPAPAALKPMPIPIVQNDPARPTSTWINERKTPGAS